MLLEQLKVLLEVEETHVHQVNQILSVFLIVLLLLHGGQVSDFLHRSLVNFGNFKINFVDDFLDQSATLSWLVDLVVVERLN